MMIIQSLLVLIYLNAHLADEEVSYSGHQLWRIGNFFGASTEDDKYDVINKFVTKFDGLLWKENNDNFDISFDKTHRKEAQSFLKEFNLVKEILIDDIQNVIDMEKSEYNKFKLRVNDLSILLKSNNFDTSWKSYPNLKAINEFLYNMEKLYPWRVKVLEIGRTVEGRILKVLRISDDPDYFNKIWVDGGIHAREWISTAAITYMIHKMLSNWDSMPYHVRTITWYFMPVLNPDGYDYAWKTNRLWHKNRRNNFLNRTRSERCRGVDLNRNFNINWKSDDQNYQPCNLNFAGRNPFSEAESLCVKEFLSARRFRLKGYLTIHSYGQSVKYPYSLTTSKATDIFKLRNGAVQMAKSASSVYENKYTAQPASKPITASGTAIDWAKVILKIPYTYQIELRDLGEKGFLLPTNEIMPSGEEAMEIVISLSNIIYENELDLAQH